MKYTITINQYAIFVHGLVNKTDAIDWIIVDYLKDFALYKKARKTVYMNDEYIWLNYHHLIINLPIIKIRCKSGITKRINKLRDLGLIKTYQQADNTLYYTFTDRLIDCLFVKNNATKSDPVNLNNTPPVHFGQTGAVHRGYTAQYKTKNTILNKDNNKERFNNTFSLKPLKDIKPQTCPDLTRKSGVSTDKKMNPNGDVRGFTSLKDVGQGFSLANQSNPKGSPYKTLKPNKEKNGFVSLQSNVWKTLDIIRQRQLQNKARNSNVKAQN